MENILPRTVKDFINTKKISQELYDLMSGIMHDYVNSLSSSYSNISAADIISIRTNVIQHLTADEIIKLKKVKNIPLVHLSSEIHENILDVIDFKLKKMKSGG